MEKTPESNPNRASLAQVVLQLVLPIAAVLTLALISAWMFVNGESLMTRPAAGGPRPLVYVLFAIDTILAFWIWLIAYGRSVAKGQLPLRAIAVLLTLLAIGWALAAAVR
jgi:hypothetical protein